MIKEIFTAALAGVVLAGCCCNTCVEFKEVDPDNYPVSAKRVTEKITVDGKLEEKVWQQTPAVELIQIPFFRGYGKALARVKQDKFQTAGIRFAYDDKYFYVAGKVNDEDIIQMDKTNQTHCYLNGDTIEVFLKPENRPYYWEIYVSPQNALSSFFSQSSGVILGYSRSKVHFMENMRSAIQINGTLNNSEDRDKYWTFELAIPIADLAKKGVPFDGKEPWKVLPARYNYDTTFRFVQLSTYPPTPIAGNNLIEYYGKIQFK